MAARYKSLTLMNWQQASGSQMPIRCNWQPDANSILDGLRRLKLNRQPANGSQVLIPFLL